MCKDVAVARHLLQVANGAFVIAFHHLADTHLVVGLTRNATGQVLLINVVILKGFVIVFLLEIGISHNLRHLRLAFLVGLADILGPLLYHRLVIAFEVVDLHDVGRHHVGIVLMRAQAAEVVQRLVVFLLDILDVSVIITRRILVFAFVHHQTVKERHSLVQLARLKISIAHVELHLLGLVVAERSGISFLVDSQRFLILFFLEQVVGIKEIGMSCPGATRIIVHKLDDFGGAVGLTEIERADRLVILRVDATLRLGIGDLCAILGESGKRSTVFLILEE